MAGGDRMARAGHRSALAVAALELALEGHPLIPLHTPRDGRCSCGNHCGRVGKHPRGLLGLRSASSDPGQVEAWWWAQPLANIGLRCDRLLVFDLDGPAGRCSLWRLQEELGELPASREQRSGRGRHLFYALADEIAVGNSTAPLGNPPGLDLRAGARGYIIAAPSLHENGHTYRWHDGDAPIAPLPRAWLERLQRPRRPSSTAAPYPAGDTTAYGLVALRRELRNVRTAPEGQRNEALNRSTFKLAQLVAGGELALEHLVDDARAAALANGLGETETNDTIHSALTAGLAFPRSRKPR